MRDLFSRIAPAYARNRPSYPYSVVRFLSTLISPGAVVWEAGCGSGQFTTTLAGEFDRIIASDASAAQIAAAVRHPHVAFVVDRAEQCALADNAVTLSVTAQAAHWFDLNAYYGEVKRVSASGAYVALVSYGSVTGPRHVDSVIRQFCTGTIASYWPPGRHHVEEGYRTLPFAFEELRSPAFELRQSWTLREFLGYVGTWSATVALIAARGRGPVDDFAADLEAAWAAPHAALDFRWPLTVRVGAV